MSPSNFVIQTVHFNQTQVEIRLPKSDESIVEEEWNESKNNEDLFPYWRTLWNSVFGLVEYLNVHPFDEDAVILELGTGSGVLPQIFTGRKGRWIFSDLVENSLHFIQSLGVLRTDEILVCGSWNHNFCNSLDCIVASDILYEKKFAANIAEFAMKSLKVGGQMIIANPSRTGREAAVLELLHFWPGTVRTQNFIIALSTLQVEIEVAILEKV